MKRSVHTRPLEVRGPTYQSFTKNGLKVVSSENDRVSFRPHHTDREISRYQLQLQNFFYFVIPASQEALAGGIGKLLVDNVPGLPFYVTLMSAI